MRAGGAGGQHVNKTESAVRIWYKKGTPEELEVKCQDERSQHKNYDRAMRRLRSLLYERQTGRLAALVAVTVQFEAIEGGDMEGLPAVGNLRNASAVFFYDRGRWRTTGKTVFNLNPGEAIEHFKGQYERLPI